MDKYKQKMYYEVKRNLDTLLKIGFNNNTDDIEYKIFLAFVSDSNVYTKTNRVQSFTDEIEDSDFLKEFDSDIMHEMVFENKYDGINSLYLYSGLFNHNFSNLTTDDFIIILQIKKNSYLTANAYMNDFITYIFSDFTKWLRRNGFFLNDIQTEIAHIVRGSGIVFINDLCQKMRKGINLKKYSKYANDVYTAVDNISALKYEGAKAKGAIVIYELDRINSSLLKIKFSDPMLLVECKVIRKMIEISSEDLLLVSDGKYAYGFIDIIDLTKKNILLFEFTGIHKWRLTSYIKNNPLYIMDIVNSFPYISKSLTKETFYIIFVEIFKNVNSIEKQWSILERAKLQHHGTMLLFSKEAMLESDRLSRVGITIIKGENDKYIKSITSIDGAVILDEHGDIYSFGVILDGNSTQTSEESISRGARYNSAIKYTASSKYECLIVVISEDNYIDIIYKGKAIWSQ